MKQTTILAINAALLLVLGLLTSGCDSKTPEANASPGAPTETMPKGAPLSAQEQKNVMTNPAMQGKAGNEPGGK